MAIKLLKKNARATRKHKHSQQNMKNKMRQKYPKQNIKFKIRPEQEPKDERKEVEDNVIVAQEIKYVKLLASNEKNIRDKALKSLTKWLTMCSKSSFAFTEADFMRLWKGLFYYMWMSDKPLIQEEVAESISNLVHCFHHAETTLLYTKCALKTLATEWFGIDQYRLDKFEMLVRRIVRQTFEACKRGSWNNELISGVENIMESLLLDSKTVLGFSLHLTELYMEELAKVSYGQIPNEAVTELIKPFVVHLAGMIDERQIKHVKQHIFTYLILQSEVGLDYKEKFEAWREAGFPGGVINSMQKIEKSNDDAVEDEMKDENEKKIGNHIQSEVKNALDPRAGRVDVEIPQLPFSPVAISNLIMEYRFHPSTTTKVRKQIIHLAKEFIILSRGKMPIGIKRINIPKRRKSTIISKKAAARLMHFQKELYSDSIEKGRKRKRSKKIVQEDKSNDDISGSLNEKAMLQKIIRTNKRNDVDSELSNVSENDEYSDVDNMDNENIIKPQKKLKTKVRKQIEKSNCSANTNDINISELECTNNINQEEERNTSKGKKASTGQNIHIKQETKLEHSKASLHRKLKMKSRKPTTTPTNGSTYITDVKCQHETDDFNYVVNPVTLIKAKKLKKNNSCGSWDISDNDSPSMLSALSEFVDKEINNDSKSNKVLNNNIKSMNASAADHKLLPTTWLTPVLKKLEKEETRQLNLANSKTGTDIDANLKKRVKIVLQKNTAQHTSEYIRQLRQSPEIPYDADRKPRVGVLKPSPLTNPLNPFYKKS